MSRQTPCTARAATLMETSQVAQVAGKLGGSNDAYDLFSSFLEEHAVPGRLTTNDTKSVEGFQQAARDSGRS